MTAAALQPDNWCWSLGLDRKLISHSPAPCREPSPRIRGWEPPSARRMAQSRPTVFACAISSSSASACSGVSNTGIGSSAQCFQDLFGDVHARADGDGILEDDVVALLFGNGLDGGVRALDDGREFLVAAAVEILLEFAA